MEAMRQFRDVTKRFTAKAKETSKAPFGPKITADLTNLRATQKALNVGDKLPTSLELTLPSGEKLNVNELAKTKPIVLIFFSGNWCPFCSMQLESFSETAEGFANLGAEIIAISPMLDPATSNYVRANNIPYKVVGGTSGQAAMNLFSLNFRPIDEVYVALKTAGVDMTAVHGVEEDFEMPLSATYVINTRGEIAYAFIEDDLASRANVDEVAAAIIRTQRSRE
jgi:peroxiredoxin